MERIKQAIEKVKGQLPNEGGLHAQEQPGYRSNTTVPGVPHSPEMLEDIKYTQTRVVKLQAERLEKYRVFALNKTDPTSVTFGLLRTQILQKMEEHGWRTLAITSPTPAVGKTVIGINLAMSIAQETNRTAMLVDFDLRQPRMGYYLGLPMEKSLNDWLDGNGELSDILINPGVPRLVVLPARNSVSNPAETLSSRKISGIIKELRSRYPSRIVIFDLPSLLYSDDAISVMPQIDCVLLVIANGMSNKREIEDSLRHLSKANLIGTVFNKA
jgi:capsular exopolysaccharide synthesis family protein